MDLRRFMTTAAYSGEAACLASRLLVLLMAIVIALLVSLCALFSLAPCAWASQTAQEEALSMTVKTPCGCVFTGQEQVSIWRVAQVGDNGALIPVGIFENISDGWDIESAPDARALADSLEAFVVESNADPTAVAPIGEDGAAVFSEGYALEHGCYLVMGSRHQTGAVWHQFMPSLVMLPQVLSDGSRDCTPSIIMKYTEQEDEGGDVPTPSPPPDPGERVPQTGQLWWPVAALLIIGAGLLILGMRKIILKRSCTRSGGVLVALGLLLAASGLALAALNVEEEKQAELASSATLAQAKELIGVQDDKGVAFGADTYMPTEVINGYPCVGVISIPGLGLELPVLSEWSYDALKIAPCRYAGSAYSNNLVVCAHNYRTHFASLSSISYGESVLFTDIRGNVFRYEVASIETLNSTAVKDMVESNYELTLFTCNLGGTARVTVRCTMVF
ncbi:MAG: sortase [Eggerthellaceae bacterium]|nr:sortase [Eggerthellaceae bacterium]